VYVNTDQQDKAKQVEACAGMGDGASGSTE